MASEQNNPSDKRETGERERSTRGISRRAVIAGAVAAVAAIGGGVAVAHAKSAASSGAASGASDGSATTSSELTSEQKVLLKQFKANYDAEAQAAIKQKLDAKYAAGTYDDVNPYVVSDPFGTDTLSCYVRFATADAVRVSYTVAGRKKSGDVAKVAEFSRVPAAGDAAATEHEFKVWGLIPGIENTVTLTCTDEAGVARTSTFTVTAPALKGAEEQQLKTTAGESNTQLADGLYAILGNDSSKLDFMYFYDNAGQIRGEVPIIGYRSHRLLFPGDGSMVFSVAPTKLARVSALGQVTAVYDTGDYELHHDYAFDGSGNLLVLASDAGTEADLDVDRKGEDKSKADRVSVEDMLIKIDISTGKVTKVVDLGDIFPALKASAKVASDGDLDWIHINTVQWLDGDTVLLSSRETSTIIKLTDIFGTPTVDWLMGSPDFWAGSGFEDKVLQAQGDFSLNAGQHSVTYLPSEETAQTGRYDLLVFDNNLGAAESYPAFDWGKLGAAVVTDYSRGEHSFARRFAVDEQARTYTLTEQFEVPFSGYVSSVQNVGDAGSVLVDSGQKKTFTEYDRYGLPIKTYEMAAEKYIYRVYKYEL